MKTRIKLKPVSSQVIVITGATSGIGLTTARRAAKQGAKVFLISRNGDALEQIAQRINAEGGHADFAVADVADAQQLQNAADKAIARFGVFDTWVNNAGISIYGTSEQVPVEDQRRLFETNFWGVVNGSLIAAKHLKQHGGALINLGSELSDVAVPLQGAYSASKHAVKGYTDALRVELQHEGAPISVTLIKPAGIDTLFVQHAKNYLDKEPKLPQPVYAPDIVAEAILHAAAHQERDIYIGGAARITAASAHHAPRTTDAMMRRFMFSAQVRGNSLRRNEDNALYSPGAAMRERSGRNGSVRERSFYTQARLHKKTSGAVAMGLAGLLLACVGAIKYKTIPTPA
ncbi:MAG: SDR family oxidoreductase [Janthinobacterium lividum]